VGQYYATVALLGSLVYGSLIFFVSAPEVIAELAVFLAAFLLRGAAIVFGIRPGSLSGLEKLSEKMETAGTAP